MICGEMFFIILNKDTKLNECAFSYEFGAFHCKNIFIIVWEHKLKYTEMHNDKFKIDLWYKVLGNSITLKCHKIKRIF